MLNDGLHILVDFGGQDAGGQHPNTISLFWDIIQSHRQFGGSAGFKDNELDTLVRCRFLQVTQILDRRFILGIMGHEDKLGIRGRLEMPFQGFGGLPAGLDSR